MDSTTDDRLIGRRALHDHELAPFVEVQEGQMRQVRRARLLVGTCASVGAFLLLPTLNP